MIEKLTHVPLVVEDQERSLRFFTEKLGWEKRTDNQSLHGRFLTIAPKRSDVEFILYKGRKQVDLYVGGDAGTAGFHWAFPSEDVPRDYETLKAKGVDFHVGDYTGPQKQFWGWNAAFKDPDGNMFLLVQPNFIGRMFKRIQNRKVRVD